MKSTYEKKILNSDHMFPFKFSEEYLQEQYYFFPFMDLSCSLSLLLIFLCEFCVFLLLSEIRVFLLIKNIKSRGGIQN